MIKVTISLFTLTQEWWDEKTLHPDKEWMKKSINVWICPKEEDVKGDGAL